MILRMRFFPIYMFLFIWLFACKKEDDKNINVFPEQSGIYNIGTEAVLITKEIIINNDSSITRHLNVKLWYPSHNRETNDFAPYISDSLLIKAFKKDQYMNLKDSVINSWKTLNINASINGEILQNKGPFPLIIFSHGFGMSKANYASFCIALASHGYIVATIDHPESGLTILPNGQTLGLIPRPAGPDGKVKEFCNDASYVITQLINTKKYGNAINKNQIGIIGHSLGGAAALNIGLYDSRFKAAINLDGYLFGEAMKKGVKSPFMAILQQPKGKINVPDSMKLERQNEWRGIMEKSHKENYVMKVRGLMHFDFSDFPHIIPDSLRVKNGGVLSPEKQYKILNKLIISFFDAYLKNQPKKTITKYIDQTEEVTFEVGN